MKYRALTVTREFGSGGGRIANTIAGWLHWKLLDRDIIESIARAAQVNPDVVSHYDERVDSWLRRMNEQAVRGVAMAAAPLMGKNDIFDAQVMTELTRKIVEEAYAGGDCVIVGSRRPMHPRKPSGRLPCLRLRAVSGTYAAAAEKTAHRHQHRTRIRMVDEERAHYLQQRFGKGWCNPHLYDLMISSQVDEDATAKIIVEAMGAQLAAA